MNTEITDTPDEIGQHLWLQRSQRCTRPFGSGGESSQPPRRHLPLDVLPLLLLPFGAAMFRGLVPRWMFMWVMAFAIYAGCKWLAYRRSGAGCVGLPARIRLAYLLCWPGMSFDEFIQKPSSKNGSPVRRWAEPVGKTLLGAVLIWLIVPRLSTESASLPGWVGMTGLVLMLHFGLFQLLAVGFQTIGLNARPLMRSPLLARSLADFWGNRWNTAFNALAVRYGFRPLTVRFGPRVALVTVFLGSGLVHECVITFPAGGGYGLPTIYFAFQAAGLLVERGTWIRRRPRVKRLLAWGVLVLPLGCLFPPVFLREIILPLLSALGAWGTAL